MEAAENLRKKLTSNSDAELFIDQLMNGEDVELKITKDAYKEII